MEKGKPSEKSFTEVRNLVVVPPYTGASCCWRKETKHRYLFLSCQLFLAECSGSKMTWGQCCRKKMKSLFFYFVGYQKAERQLKIGRNVPHWHSSFREPDSFLRYKTNWNNVHCGSSPQGKETLNTLWYFSATPVLQWGIISKSLPLQGKNFLQLCSPLWKHCYWKKRSLL